MSADPILYCLEHLTDYRQFERLATDIMAATSYPNIEPIGGTGDGGRDALHCHEETGELTVFAYSVRGDWETKLHHDCRRISSLEHKPKEVVFVSTQEISANKRDKQRTKVHEDYGWQLTFYDIERIRTLLNGPLHEIIVRHPSIFVAPWFQRRGGQLITHEQRDLVIVDHLPIDHAFATWLFRKLSLMGYSVWCHGLAPLAGESADASVRALIQKRSACYMPVFSKAAMRNADFMGRAALDADRTIPCWLSDLESNRFAAPLRSINPALFGTGWRQGLMHVVQQLENRGVAKPLEASTGTRVALKAYMTEPLLNSETEHVYSNEFLVNVPAAIYSYKLMDRNTTLPDELSRRWAFLRRGNRLLAFAPDLIVRQFAEPSPTRYSWRDFENRFGINSEDLIKILVKRSLRVACAQSGFQICAESEGKLLYLNETRRQLHGYQHVDGRQTGVSLAGTRNWRSGLEEDRFRYQLAPIFSVRIDDKGQIWALLRFYVRLTGMDGLLLPKHKIQSRRKLVTRNWWNKEWFQRTLAMMQYIAGDGSGIDGEIVVGDEGCAVVTRVKPRKFESPVGIDVEALDRVGNFQEEIATARTREDETESEPDSDV